MSMLVALFLNTMQKIGAKYLHLVGFWGSMSPRTFQCLLVPGWIYHLRLLRGEGSCGHGRVQESDTSCPPGWAKHPWVGCGNEAWVPPARPSGGLSPVAGAAAAAPASLPENF